MSQGDKDTARLAAVILVPCECTDRVGCRVVRKAVALLARETPEAVVAEAADCPRGGKRFVVAVDGSSRCQASAALAACGSRPSVVVSAPEVLARAGLVKPGRDLRAGEDELASALASAIGDSLEGVLEELRERKHYREEMSPVMDRFEKIWSRAEALPPPNGEAEASERQRIELLGKRSRNLFVRFDELVPPAEWSEPHDLFQDALLCIAYATEGWTAGDAERWELNMEKARAQIRPLMRRLEG